MVALETEDCGAAMDPSSGGRVGVEPTRETWPECREDPVAVDCGRVIYHGSGWKRGRGWGKGSGGRGRRRKGARDGGCWGQASGGGLRESYGLL